jgi:hypothetical protein
MIQLSDLLASLKESELGIKGTLKIELSKELDPSDAKELQSRLQALFDRNYATTKTPNNAANGLVLLSVIEYLGQLSGEKPGN